MALDQRDLADSFQYLCRQHLAANEIALLNTICGLEGRRAQSIAEVASYAQRSGDVVRRVLNEALLKLPRADLAQLRDRLDEDSTVDQGRLSAEQRRRLLKLIEYGLIIQEAYVPKAQSRTMPPTAPHVFAPMMKREPSLAPARSRPQILADILDRLGRPAHYARIAEIAARDHTTSLKSNLAYQTMVKHRDFVLVGEGMFALARWQNRTADARLRYCPPLPLRADERAEAFFEQTLIARQWAAEMITYRGLVERVQRSGIAFTAQDLLDLKEA